MTTPFDNSARQFSLVQGGFGNSGEPPHNGGMEARVAKLENFAQDTRARLTRIEAQMESFERNFATKADLHKALNDQTWKIIGFVSGIGAALTAAVYFIARNVQ